MLLSDITGAVNSDLGITIDTTWLENTLVPRAVRLYSIWAGVETDTTITTVADQEEYTLPADCAVVTEVEWWPSGTDLLSGDVVAPAIVDTATAQGYGYTRPSEHLIDNINRAAVTRQLRGYWRQKNTTTLVLDPKPTASGLSVPVTYLKVHVLSGSGVNRQYATIPAHLLDALVLLTKAEYLDSLSDRAAWKDDFRQGGTQLTRAHVSGNLNTQIQRLRRRALGLMGVGGAIGEAA